MPSRPPIHSPPHASPAANRKTHDIWRGSSASRGYDNDWRIARLDHLKSHPLCVWCHRDGRVTAATVVDHIKPIVDRPDLRLDPSNFRSLCKPHHDAHTAGQVAQGHVGMVGAMRPTRL